MPITFGQLERHLRQQGKWQGFSGLTFDLRLLTVDQALGCLNAWSNGTLTIRDYTRRELIAGTLNNLPKIMSYAGTFRDGPVLLVGFTLTTLARIWSDKYGEMEGDDLVIWDGHHRMAALAIREQLGVRDDHPVVVFVGS